MKSCAYTIDHADHMMTALESEGEGEREGRGGEGGDDTAAAIVWYVILVHTRLTTTITVLSGLTSFPMISDG